MTVVDFFFRHVFDEFEVFDFSERVREAFLGIRGGSRRPLGGSWGSPGGPGGRLGRVLGALGAILEGPLRQFDFGSIF